MQAEWGHKSGTWRDEDGKMGVRYRMEETGAHNGCFIDEQAASLTKFFAVVKA